MTRSNLAYYWKNYVLRIFSKKGLNSHDFEWRAKIASSYGQTQEKSPKHANLYFILKPIGL